MNYKSKKTIMKKVILLLTTILTFTSCQKAETTGPSEADKATFARNIKAFENHHVKGFATRMGGNLK